MEEITQATEADAGCWISSWWGQYGTACMVEAAECHGYDNRRIIGLARLHRLSMGPSDSEGLTDDEYEELFDAADDVEQWLNANVAPAGFSFGWSDGEFFLQPAAWWEEEA